MKYHFWPKNDGEKWSEKLSPSKVLFFFQFDLGVLRPIISNHETNPGGNDPASLTFLFAENPWSCDCEFVKEIQEFLYHRIPFLRDAELLYCGGEPVSTKNLAFKVHIF